MRNADLAGKYHGIGIPAKVGTKVSGFANDVPKKDKKMAMKPPKKVIG